MESNMPSDILKTLQNAGYEAYYVGGCVRDTLLGRPIHDWDITTSALPEEIMSCFSHFVPTGIKHGTITVLLNHVQAEVTTYRTDGSYSDGRHPEQVRFVNALSEDLGRRDFTINAMAMDLDGRIIDLYGGKEDLQSGVVRCVGDPDRRFQEDALRMFRAFRFSAQLGFSIEPQTMYAIGKHAGLARSLSVERIRDEVEKTLLSDCPERIDDMVHIGLLNTFDLKLTDSCKKLKNLPKERSVRWAGFCRLCPGLDLRHFRLDKATAIESMAASLLEPPDNRLGWKFLIAQYGVSKAKIVASLNGCSDLIEEILNSGECLSLKDLAVGGKDFPNLQGKACGEHLRKLLLHTLSHPEDNIKKILLEISIK